MATCKWNPGINSYNPYAVLTVTESSYNVANNTSVVAWDLKLYRPSSISSSAQKDFKVIINGSTVKSGTTTIGGSGTKTIASGTTTISHNSDGAKTISFSFNLEVSITWSGKATGDASASGSLKLTTIPRATTPIASASSVNIGDSVTFTLNRASTSFTHKLTYKFGTLTGTIGTGLTTSTTWTVPSSFAEQIPNATSGTCTITCTTYNGSSTVGTKSITITLKVKSSVVPTVTLTFRDLNTLVAERFADYAKGLSRLEITASGTGASGSTIKSYSISANGVTYNTAKATTGLLSESGTMTIKVTVTDSRGRTGSKTASVYVFDYAKPYVDTFTVVRCDADGTENDEGANAKVVLVGGVTNIPGNTATYKVQYKRTEDDSYTAQVLDVTSLTVNKTVIIKNIDTEATYDFRAVVADPFNEVYAIGSLSTAFTLVDYHSSGQGISFGKVATEPNKADFDLQIIPRKGFNNILLTPETNLNDVVKPNIYYGENVDAYNYLNCPINSGTFTLEVASAGDEGQLRQIFTVCSKTNPIKYERFYYGSAWGEWMLVPTFALLNRVFGMSYNLDVTLTKGTNYTSVSGDAYLVGNLLRCNISATRSSAVSGNVANELVATFKITHGGKIAGILHTTFGNGATGHIASFYTTNLKEYDDYLTFDVQLSATGGNLTELSTFFTMPITLNLIKF